MLYRDIYYWPAQWASIVLFAGVCRRLSSVVVCKAPSIPATMSEQMPQVERFFRQCRLLLRHCCSFWQQCCRFRIILTVDRGTTVIHPVNSVHDLGVHSDSEQTMKTHISKVVSSCFYPLRRIRQVRRLVGQDVTQQQVSSLDDSTTVTHCLSRLPRSIIQPLQRMMNATASVSTWPGQTTVEAATLATSRAKNHVQAVLLMSLIHIAQAVLYLTRLRNVRPTVSSDLSAAALHVLLKDEELAGATCRMADRNCCNSITLRLMSLSNLESVIGNYKNCRVNYPRPLADWCHRDVRLSQRRRSCAQMFYRDVFLLRCSSCVGYNWFFIGSIASQYFGHWGSDFNVFCPRKGDTVAPIGVKFSVWVGMGPQNWKCFYQNFGI